MQFHCRPTLEAVLAGDDELRLAQPDIVLADLCVCGVSCSGKMFAQTGVRRRVTIAMLIAQFPGLELELGQVEAGC